MEDKSSFIRAMRSESGTIAVAWAKLDDLCFMYFDREYSAGADVITEAEAEAQGTTVADIAATITMIEQLRLFFGGGGVTPAQYSTTLNRIRGDV